MKIATITCNNAENYGARLQAFALQKYLTSLGHEVRVIDYEPIYMHFDTKLWYFPGLNVKGWGKLLLQLNRRRSMLKKHKLLNDFTDRYMSLTEKYRSIDQLCCNPPVADMYVAGSDQIWNTDFANGKDPAFYLTFAPIEARCISYAASFAIPSIPESLRSLVSEYLSHLDVITVREPSAVNIVKSLGFESKLVCDPVFLLTDAFWGEEFADNTGEGEDYVLVYDFEKSAELRDVAKFISKKYGYRIYSVSPWHLGYAHRNYCACRPESFVALFKNARFVVSNSLHGTIFSLIFKREFFVVNRIDGLNVRMADLMSLLDINGRIVTRQSIAEALDSVIEYDKVGKCLAGLIDTSKDFLINIANQ